MKRTILIIVLLILLVGGISLGFVYWKYFRGIGPAISSPDQDITSLIPGQPQENLPSAKEALGFPLELPQGFTISTYAKNLNKPRVLVEDPLGTLVVSLTNAGSIVALPDRDEDGRSDGLFPIVSGLDRPHGIAFDCPDECSLYVADEGSVMKYDYDALQMKARNGQKIIDLPTGGRHYTRTLLIGPDPDTGEDKLFISIGSSCDTCVEDDSRRSAIYYSNMDGSDFEPYSTGLRNSVFMTLDQNNNIWATEMGRDFLGDDLPPDEVNLISKNFDYGWPYCYGKKIHDAKFSETEESKQHCRKSQPTAIDIPAHSSPLGLDFVLGEQWPEEIQGDLLVVYHGSWNRTVPTGYKIVRYSLDEDLNVTDTNDFVSGWLNSNNNSLGRPADVFVPLDGNAIFISDDKANVVYRLQYHPDQN